MGNVRYEKLFTNQWLKAVKQQLVDLGEENVFKNAVATLLHMINTDVWIDPELWCKQITVLPVNVHF